MTTIEAYNLTLSKIEELRKKGIEVTIKPSKSRDNEELQKRFKGPERIPSNLWTFVTFTIKNKGDAIAVYEMANYLGMCGIRFDTGGCACYRDWEIDWSFQYRKGEENEDWRDARDDIEDMISELGNESSQTTLETDEFEDLI